MDPLHSVQTSFYNQWEGGEGHVDISVQSMPTATDPRLVGRAEVTFNHQIRSVLVGAPPNEDFLTTMVHESWLEDLQTFSSFEEMVAAQIMFAHIRVVPYMPIFVQDYFINNITNQARGAAVTAAALHNRAVSMVVDLNTSINWIYDDDYDDGDDDDDDDDGGGGGDDDDDDDDGASLLAEVDELAPFLEAIGLQRGLTPAAIAHHLTVDTFMGGSPQECPICLEGMVTGTQVGWLPCRHVFHPACITSWLERSATCPICRLQLSNNIGD